MNLCGVLKIATDYFILIETLRETKSLIYLLLFGIGSYMNEIGKNENANRIFESYFESKLL